MASTPPINAKGQGTSSVTVSLPPAKPAPRQAPTAPAAPTTQNTNRPPVAPFATNASSPDTGTNTNEAAVKFMPQPNPMNDYYQHGYYFRWYLLNEFIDPKTALNHGMTIAETGATGLNLVDVQIESVIGPNSQTKGTMATQITMTVVEPIGAMLPNVLYRAASDLKIKNYHKAPWMLELKLFGVDRHGKRIIIEDKVWRWQMMLINVDSKVSKDGATHTVTAIPIQEVALDNQYCMLTESFAVKGDTISQVLENLTKSMNKSAALRYGETFRVFKIEDRPYDDAPVVARPFDHKIVSETPQENDARNQGVGSFSPGTDIPSIINSLFATSPTALQQARHSRTLDFMGESEGKDSNTGLDPEADISKMQPFSMMHRIDTEVKITGWNPVYQDYCREITYVVRPYESVRLITNLPNAQVSTQNVSLQRKKARHVIQRKFLTKVYDYIFTGLNTEVYDFDINLNFNWAVAVPMLGGKVHYGSTSLPQQVNERLWKAQNLSALVEKGQVAVRNYDQLLDEAEANGSLTPEQLAARRARLAANEAKIKKGEQKASEIKTDLIVDSSKDIQDTRRRVEKLEAYAEKVEEESTEPPVSDMVLPITITDDADKPNSSTDFGVSSQWHQGRSIYGALLNQMYGAVDGNLMNIDLTVRGDPYWLGPQGFQLVDRDEKPEDGASNWMAGENMFLFRFKIPMGYNKDSNGVRLTHRDLGDTDTYNGFYVVIKVLHQFIAGEFKQTLSGTRVPGWEVSKVLDMSGDAPAKEDGE